MAMQSAVGRWTSAFGGAAGAAVGETRLRCPGTRRVAAVVAALLRFRGIPVAPGGCAQGRRRGRPERGIGRAARSVARGAKASAVQGGNPLGAYAQTFQRLFGTPAADLLQPRNRVARQIQAKAALAPPSNLMQLPWRQAIPGSPTERIRTPARAIRTRPSMRPTTGRAGAVRPTAWSPPTPVRYGCCRAARYG